MLEQRHLVVKQFDTHMSAEKLFCQITHEIVGDQHLIGSNGVTADFGGSNRAGRVDSANRAGVIQHGIGRVKIGSTVRIRGIEAAGPVTRKHVVLDIGIRQIGELVRIGFKLKH
jgi:hypothetical protein